jgi:hypothetical protein
MGSAERPVAGEVVLVLSCPNARLCGGSVEMKIEAGTYGKEHRALDYVIAAVGGEDGRSCDHGCRLSEAQVARLCRDATYEYYRQSGGLLRK